MIGICITLPFPFSGLTSVYTLMFCFQRSCACEDGGWTLAMVSDGTWHDLQTPMLKIILKSW